MNREKRTPFKLMKEHSRIAMSAAAFLLGMESIIWKDEDYARFMTLADTVKQIAASNPTHEQCWVATVAMIRFYKTIVERVPDEELKAKGQALYNQLSIPYGKWLEIKERVTDD